MAREGLIEQVTPETKLKAPRASRGKARGNRKLESEGRKACLAQLGTASRCSAAQ